MCWFTSVAPDFWLDKQWRKAGIKLRRHAFKPFTSFSRPCQMSQSLNLFVFPVKSTMFSYVWIGIHVWAKISGVALGLANADPWVAQNLLMPHPHDWQGGEQGAWMHVELTDALFKDIFEWHCSSSKTDFLCKLYWYVLWLLDKRKCC